MKNETACYKTIKFFVAVLFTMFAFGAISWYFGQPWRTRSAIGSAGIIVVAMGLVIAAEGFRSFMVFRMLQVLATLSYIVGGVALAYLLVSNIWHQPSVYAAPASWTVILAMIFLATHWLRSGVKREVCALEAERLGEPEAQPSTATKSATEPAI